MKKIFSILIIIHCSFIIANAQWVEQVSGVDAPMYNVQFVNRYTGWVTGGNSMILKTTNAGINWFQQTIDLAYPKNLYGLSMLDENTGYIAGWFETILKTTNGGTNWMIISNIPSNSGNSNSAISFVNSQNGWICSYLGRVLRTTNGGANWDTANVGSTGPLEDIQFVNSQTGWVCGDVGNLRKTTNGGINWVQTPLLTTANLDGLFFLNPNTGWTVSEQDNMVFKTTDSGISWDTVAILPGGNLMYSYTIYFSSALTGWIGGTNSRIFKTTDGGFNWVRENAVYLAFFNNFSFYGDSVGWAVGGHGTIINTTSSGEPVGVVKIAENVSSNSKLYQNYPNPFNPVTTIEFDISSPGTYRLEIFDMLGRKVDKIFDEYKTSGKYKIKCRAENLSSGIYLYILSSDQLRNIKKMIVLK